MTAMALLVVLALAVPVAAQEGMVDPTRPVDYLADTALPAPVADAAADWRLTAVRIGTTDRSAIINGQVVRAGDTFAGRARVLEIQPGMVAVELDRKRIELRLHGGGVTKQKTQQTETAVAK